MHVWNKHIYQDIPRRPRLRPGQGRGPRGSRRSPHYPGGEGRGVDARGTAPGTSECILLHMHMHYIILLSIIILYYYIYIRLLYNICTWIFDLILIFPPFFLSTFFFFLVFI